MRADPNRVEADLFFALIADHGRFNEAQLYRYVELKRDIALGGAQRAQLLAYAKAHGAKREKGLYEIYQMPVKRQRRARKQDVVTIDMFGGK